MRTNTVIIMAGGTGGHVFPGLAVAEALASHGIGTEWLGTATGIEASLVPARQIPLHVIPVKGVRGKGRLQQLFAPLNILIALIAALKVIWAVKPRLVLGFGGYVSGPGGIAAKICGIPLIIHEQNAVAGTTNRLLANIAKRVFTAFPCGLKNGECIGNPVRAEISAIPAPGIRMREQNEPIKVLVLGGSRGAKAINELVPSALANLHEVECSVWHQTGAGKGTQTIKDYERVHHEYKIEEFITDVSKAYAWADIVICRSGALTVSEIAAAGLAAIFIPFPYAIDDHQTANAEFLAAAGAAIIRQQRELNVDNLTELLSALCSDKTSLISMAEKARSVAKTDAATKVAEYCGELLDVTA